MGNVKGNVQVLKAPVDGRRASNTSLQSAIFSPFAPAHPVVGPGSAQSSSAQWSGQVRLSGARRAREQQGVARQAVAYRVIHVPPPLFWGRPACRPGGAAPSAVSAKRFGSRCVSRESVFTCAR